MTTSGKSIGSEATSDIMEKIDDSWGTRIKAAEKSIAVTA